MNGPLGRTLLICVLLGIISSFAGGCQCTWGHNYAVAAQHQSTTVGHVVRISGGKGGPYYHYVFSVNGVAVDDSSNVCHTPLAPGACDNLGPVLVYYSHQPFAISKLQDFTSASNDAYRFGKPALAIGLPLFVWSTVIMVILSRKNKPKHHPNPDGEKGRSKSGDVPDVIHIVPGE